MLTAHGHGTTVTAWYLLNGIAMNLMVITLKTAQEYTEVMGIGMIMIVMNNELSSAEVSMCTECCYWKTFQASLGGTHIRRWYGYVSPSRPHCSCHFVPSETHYFKPFFSPRDSTDTFWKIWHFQPNSFQVFSKVQLMYKKQILAKIRSQDPGFKA